MVRDEIIPAEEEYMAEVGKAPGGDRFEFTARQVDIREGLKARPENRACGIFG